MNLYHLEHPCPMCHCPDIVVTLTNEGMHFMCNNCFSSWHVHGAGFDDRMVGLFRETVQSAERLYFNHDEESGCYYE